jgi:hypothetical protein
MNGIILIPCLHAYLLEIGKTMGVLEKWREAWEKEIEWRI